MSDLVSMQVSPEVIKPIVEAKIKEAIAAALGGPDTIVKTVVDRVLTTKVNANGVVSQYSSDNKFNYIDMVVTRHIEDAVKAEVVEQMKTATSLIQKEVAKFLQSKKGSSQIAALLCSSMAGSIGNQYRTSMTLQFTDQTRD